MRNTVSNTPEIKAIPLERVMSEFAASAVKFCGSIPEIKGYPRLNRFYRKAAAFCFAQIPAQSDTDCAYHCGFQYELLEARYLSVSLSFTRQSGTHSRLLFFDGCVWDLRSGFPVSLSLLCRIDRRQAFSFLREELDRRIRSGGTSLVPDWQKRLRHCWNPNQFYLEDKRIFLYIPPSLLAPGREGCLRFKLPDCAEIPIV